MKYKLLTAFSTVFLLFSCFQKQDDSVLTSEVQHIDDYLTNSGMNGYSGAVLIAKKGEIILSKGYGWANREKKIPNKPTSVFNIGSVTKQFTAAAILKLSEKSKLSISDIIITYFPDAPPDKQNITIHQLLTHTSGISPKTGGFRYNDATKEQFINDFFQSELLYQPGTKYTYANANYIMLAAIIEKISQQDYETYLKENFWKPLKMKHTGYKSIAFNSEQFAHGYYFHYTDGLWKDWGITQEHLPYHNNHWYSIGKGDIYSTVEDLYTWHLALENNSVLKAETKQIMETAYVPENEAETSFYGYGWAIHKSPDNSKVVTHNGSNGIYFADFIRYIDDDIVVIALSNIILNQQSENVARTISEMINDINFEPKTIPKNTYELVFDFIRINSPNKASKLPQFILNETGEPLQDKAILNRIGYKQISERLNTEWGIALLQLNVSLFPEDGNLWDTLGEGYYLLKDKDKAIESFKKAIELQPKTDCYWCENSKKRLDELLNKKKKL